MVVAAQVETHVVAAQQLRDGRAVGHVVRQRIVAERDDPLAGTRRPHPLFDSVRERELVYVNRTGCVASVSGDGRLFWAEKFASSAANDFFVDADNRLWVTFIEGKIFCLGDPVVR